MSNPTTPFNWQMPTNTDLVTDLPADFEVFGQAVATSMADLLGGTTGQILSKATNADMDFTWIANDQGDITGVTATSPLTGGGTSGAITVGIQDASTTQKGSVQLSDSTSTTSSVLASTPTAVKSAYDLASTANTAAGTAQTTANAAIPKSTVTTAGDVIYATGSSAVTRLGIGTAGQVLTVNGGATAPSWTTPSTGGGMTLISSGNLAGSGSIVISSIPNTYKNLELWVKAPTWSPTGDRVGVRVNTDTGSNYQLLSTYNSTSTAVTSAFAQSESYFYGPVNPASASTFVLVEFFDYANTNTRKMIRMTSNGLVSDSSFKQTSVVNGCWITTSAINSVTVYSNTAYSGGTYEIYGVK